MQTRRLVAKFARNRHPGSRLLEFQSCEPRFCNGTREYVLNVPPLIVLVFQRTPNSVRDCPQSICEVRPHRVARAMRTEG